MKAQRYFTHSHYLDFIKKYDGDSTGPTIFVLASDYAALEAEVARLTTILYGKPIAAPEIPEVAAEPLTIGMLNELRNSAQLHEATASAELAKETTNDATRTAE